MNKEEKKAIEKFKFCGGNFVLDKESSKVVLNLIEKLQKENEDLKADNYELNNRITDLLENIPIQRVKDKIEELNKIEQDLQNNISKEEREEYSDANISWELMDINIRRETLQELIEERKEK